LDTRPRSPMRAAGESCAREGSHEPQKCESRLLSLLHMRHSPSAHLRFCFAPAGTRSACSRACWICAAPRYGIFGIVAISSFRLPLCEFPRSGPSSSTSASHEVMHVLGSRAERFEPADRFVRSQFVERRHVCCTSVAVKYRGLKALAHARSTASHKAAAADQTQNDRWNASN